MQGVSVLEGLTVRSGQKFIESDFVQSITGKRGGKARQRGQERTRES